MKVSLSWLAGHLDFADRSTDDLADLLTFAGVEVEAVHVRGLRSDRIIVGQVREFIAHPNADRLRLCQVDDGTGVLRQIVCGAKNFSVGDKIPVALPGAILPGNFEIKESKLRGVLSQGMMCSGRELGLGDDHEGLLILAADAPVGRALHEWVETDTMFEVEITPNRPDLLCHLGIARELGALSGIPLQHAPSHVVSETPIKVAEAAEISIIAGELCGHYTARRIRGVTVAPSPDWLKRRLESVGLRCVNNVVDVTNFVLMEMGQPLHAFDAQKVTGGIIVRTAQENESFTALDEKIHRLASDDLVIADSTGPLALAGVMGGAHSAVTGATTDILLESASFQTIAVRRTSRRMALISDSSYRFERGTDGHQVIGASDLATRLICEITGGVADESILVAGGPAPRSAAVSMDNNRCRALLGAEISDVEIDHILTSLGLKKTAAGWLSPTWRLDLPRTVDLIEEVARVYGIARLPSAGAALFAAESPADEFYDFRMHLRNGLAARGLWEAQTIKLISSAQLVQSVGTTPQPLHPLPLKNPLSDDHTTMRPSVIPGLLVVAERNIRMGCTSLRFHENGTIFSATPDGKAVEKDALGILLSGPTRPTAWNATEPMIADISDLRALVESLCSGASVKLKPVKAGSLLAAATIQVNGKPIGLCGRLSPAAERSIGARHPLFAAEIDTLAFHKATRGELKFDDLQRFPAMTRDVAMEIGIEVPAGKVDDFFSASKELLLTGAALFDVFIDPSGLKLAAGKKSLAYTITYRDKTKTLETAEVDAAHQRILEGLKKTLNVSIR